MPNGTSSVLVIDGDDGAAFGDVVDVDGTADGTAYGAADGVGKARVKDESKSRAVVCVASSATLTLAMQRARPHTRLRKVGTPILSMAADADADVKRCFCVV